MFLILFCRCRPSLTRWCTCGSLNPTERTRCACFPCLWCSTVYSKYGVALLPLSSVYDTTASPIRF